MLAGLGLTRRCTARPGLARLGVARFFLKGNQMLQKMTVRLDGVAPMLMHNGQTANPTNVYSKRMKEITGKRKKTDEDYVELAGIEWEAGLYVNAQGRLIVTADMLDTCIIEGAKKSKLGKQFKSAVFVEDDCELIIGTNYKSALDLKSNENHRDIRSVKVGMNRVMRCRPIFRTWSTMVQIMFDDEQVNATDVQRALSDAGQQVGLGDYRPRYGRFSVSIA